MDPVTLARMQFAANITFHILFPAITIALGWLLLFFRWRHLVATAGNDKQAWLNAYRFWTKVFALSFALGVVSGVVMSFQFGTNWPGFMERVGDVAGPPLAYEVLTAFFLEAGFLGIMLFGHGRVSERVHLIATFFVALGTTISAFWILALNSWMQTPVGHEIVDGRFVVVDWWQVLFNPSFPYRFAHMLIASALTCAFVLAGLSAWQLLKGSAQGSAPKVLRVALTLAAVLTPLQIYVGDQHGLNTLEHQPQKVAAMEGLWRTTRGAPLLLFAIPDGQARENHFEIALPKLASLILRHDLDGEVKGLDDFRGNHPPVFAVFWAFRVMVGVGVLMLATSWIGWWVFRRCGWVADRLPRALLWWLAAMTFAGWVAVVAGWWVTEIGRQPFIVYGLVRTADVASSVPAPMIGLTLALYVVVYTALMLAYVGVLKYMAEKPEEVLAADMRDRAPSGPIGGSTVGGHA
ncbi:MAG TPA: cytochrome ubiquinol oxidase subunit I [Burkholderiaceae bacterium]|nr:cytochrome ubiquinol oxidase subunit I [Burkholderiaceae bacterium]